MLAIMFPTRNRKQLLNKYKNEEKVNPGHVKYALKHKKALGSNLFYIYILYVIISNTFNIYLLFINNYIYYYYYYYYLI